MCKNLKQAKELLALYESITKDQLLEAAGKYECNSNIYSILSDMTGFGSDQCKLCKPILSECEECIYTFEFDENAEFEDGFSPEYCRHGNNKVTYYAIRNADSIDSLFKAVKNRAFHLKMVILNYEAKNGDTEPTSSKKSG